MANNAPPQHEGKLPDFQQKLGPLPMWAWAVGVVAAYLVYSHFIRSKTSTATTDGATDLVDGNSGDILGTSGSATSGISGSTTGSTGVNGTAPTNQSWGLGAISGLIANGQYQAGDVENAITQWLSGSSLSTVNDWNIVNTALKNYGPPPTPVPVIAGSGLPSTEVTRTDFYGNQYADVFDATGKMLSETNTKYVSPEEFGEEQNEGKAPGVFDQYGGFYNPGTPVPVTPTYTPPAVTSGP
jgi:hypothetical protein